MAGSMFVVSLGEGRFLREIDGRLLTSTTAPSDAAFLGYSEAVRMVARLRSRGFPNSLVATLDGQPATFAVLQQENLPQTRADLDQMTVLEFRRRYTTEPAFRQRADELEKQPRKVAKTSS